MKKLGRAGICWLKSFHLLFAGLWLGAAVSLLLLNAFVKDLPAHELHGLDRAMRVIDDFVIIPGAMGSLLTGLVYSLWTNWGFFTYRWVTVKWAITLFGVLFGTFFLGPWLNGMEEISGRIGGAALAEPVYLHNKAMNMWGALVQVTGLAAAVAVSVIKPWGKGKVDTGPSGRVLIQRGRGIAH